MPYSKTTCVIQVIMDYDDEICITKHRHFDDPIKKQLISNLNRIYASGIRSFIINIKKHLDYWVAETIWEMSETADYATISYSIVFMNSFSVMQHAWIDREKNWKDVMSNAKRIIWKKELYPIDMPNLVLVDLSSKKRIELLDSASAWVD